METDRYLKGGIRKTPSSEDNKEDKEEIEEEDKNEIENVRGFFQ